MKKMRADYKFLEYLRKETNVEHPCLICIKRPIIQDYGCIYFQNGCTDRTNFMNQNKSLVHKFRVKFKQELGEQESGSM